MKQLGGDRNKTLSGDSEGGSGAGAAIVLVGGISATAIGLVVFLASVSPILGLLSAVGVGITGYKWFRGDFADDEEEYDESEFEDVDIQEDIKTLDGHEDAAALAAAADATIADAKPLGKSDATSSKPNNPTKTLSK